MAQETIWATGRRKTAIARVRLQVVNGGAVEINDKPFEEVFVTDSQRISALRPLALTEHLKLVSIQGRVHGGGISAQAEALSHGISRALLKLKPELRGVLKKEGLLTRDSRMKERKKYGQKGARKKFQFSKR